MAGGHSWRARAGDSDKARAALFEEARKDRRRRICASGPDAPDALALMGQIDAGVGQQGRRRCVRGQRAAELRPVTADAMDGPVRGDGALAMIYTWTGDDGRGAQAELETLEKIAGRTRLWATAVTIRRWDPLRGQARFEAMVARLDPHLAP